MQYTKEEQLRAAYALNICTVSVSQIIDYDDINILEQEYDIILNNLNLQEIPPDEALLHILKQVLDTISFFRLQEGDKKILEMEYQQKVKNAIWDAVPNFGLIVTGGMNPFSMAASLATQVGIGYMNYRRNMAEYELEHEKAAWKLQRSAMEQFHGLRRELFDTAWRLAKEYDFDDRYRLTERQIRQYNDILTDNDNAIRKYERLEAIQGNFEAYPPFWYNFGNTAALIAINNTFSEETRRKYKELAREHFEYYRKANQGCRLFREDHIAATCALEYAALLNPKENSRLITELVKEAGAASCNSHDILQLGAFTLLSVGGKEANEAATSWLRILVNENYNRILNGQILSSLLAARYKDDSINDAERKDIRSAYELLTTKVMPIYLYSLPLVPSEGTDKAQLANQEMSREYGTPDQQDVNMQEAFLQKQKFVIESQFYMSLREYFGKIRDEFERIIPYTFRQNQTVGGFESGESPEDINRKVREAEKAFHESLEAMRDTLYYADILDNWFFLLNRMLKSLYSFDFISNKDELTSLLADRIIEKKEKLLTLNKKLVNRTFTLEDYKELVSYTFTMFTGPFVRNYIKTVFSFFERQTAMQELMASETALSGFCLNNGLKNAEKLFEEVGEERFSQKEEIYISIDLLGLSVEEVKQAKELEDNMLKCIKEKSGSCLSTTDVSKIEIIYRDDPRFARTLRNAGIYKSNYKGDGLAYIDDKSMTNSDLLLTKYGVYPVWRGMRWKFAPYRNIVATEDGYMQFYGKILFDKLKCNSWNIDTLIQLFRQLSTFTATETASVKSAALIEVLCDEVYQEQIRELDRYGSSPISEDNSEALSRSASSKDDYLHAISEVVKVAGPQPDKAGLSIELDRLNDWSYMEEIETAAKSGNAEAQYALAAHWYTRNADNGGISLHWGRKYLDMAVKQGYGRALDTKEKIKKLESDNVAKIETILQRRYPEIKKNASLSILFKSDIKASILDNIHNSWLGSRQKTVIAFFNTTVFDRNCGKDGLLFTTDGFGFTYAFEHYFVPYAELDMTLIKKGGKEKELKFNYGDPKPYISNINWKLSELKSCLETIRELFDYHGCFVQFDNSMTPNEKQEEPEDIPANNEEPKEEYSSEEANSNEPAVLAESYDDSSLDGVARREGITLNNRFNVGINGGNIKIDGNMIKMIREVTGLSTHDSKIMVGHNSTIAVFLPYENAAQIQGIIGTSLSIYLSSVEPQNVKLSPVLGELISQKIIKEHKVELKADMISRDLQVRDPVVLETSQKSLIGGITTKAGRNTCEIYCAENVSGEILKVWKMVN